MDKDIKQAVQNCEQVLYDDSYRLKREIIDLNNEILILKVQKQTKLIKYAIEQYEKDIETNQKIINSILYILGGD